VIVALSGVCVCIFGVCCVLRVVAWCGLCIVWRAFVCYVAWYVLRVFFLLCVCVACPLRGVACGVCVACVVARMCRAVYCVVFFVCLYCVVCVVSAVCVW